MYKVEEHSVIGGLVGAVAEALSGKANEAFIKSVSEEDSIISIIYSNFSDCILNVLRL